MRREHQPSIVLAFVSVVFLLLISIKPHEAIRLFPRDDSDEQVWMRKKNLLLPSLWNPVKSPTPNPGTNSALAGEKHFAAVGKTSNSHLLLPSLQWRKVTPPTQNPGTNSALAGEKNFAGTGGGLPRREINPNHLLLPSLQWRPVKPPSTNPGHNSVGTVSERSFAGRKMTAATASIISSQGFELI